jgi:hypothetical protein
MDEDDEHDMLDYLARRYKSTPRTTQLELEDLPRLALQPTTTDAPLWRVSVPVSIFEFVKYEHRLVASRRKADTKPSAMSCIVPWNLRSQYCPPSQFR